MKKTQQPRKGELYAEPTDLQEGFLLQEENVPSTEIVNRKVITWQDRICIAVGLAFRVQTIVIFTFIIGIETENECKVAGNKNEQLSCDIL